ncbi:MAG TPA: AI-2E family transporter [bacterium]|nr:AI-2E family transporter [bacterium]HPN42456.1 AI-2E family transporter [bacterium]
MKLTSFFHVLVITILIFYLLVVGKDLLIPLVLAIIIWYLINILALGFKKIKLFRWRLPLAICYVLSVITISGVLYLLVTLISNNIADVIVVAPSYQKKLSALIAQAYALLGRTEPPTLQQIFQKIDIGGVLSQFAVVITGFISNTGVILVYLIFIFLEQKSFKVKLMALIENPERQKDIFKMIEKVDNDIRIYIGIKTFVSALTAILGYFVMASQKLDFAEFWAILIFCLNFIPTIGSIIATFLPVLFALIQFDRFLPIIIIGLGLTFLQFTIGNILDPKLMGNNLNLSPLVILVSLALWGALWGIAGMLLCVPITVIIFIVLSHFPKTRPLAIFLSQDGKINLS